MAIVYVNIDAEGSNSGSSWEDAYQNLQDALDNAEKGDEIWVAEGTYKPTESGNRNTSFTLKNSVNVYGGFAGNETSLNDRDFRRNETILSGNIGDESQADDNSYHVVKAKKLDEETTLDGFTITEGFNADQSQSSSESSQIYGAGILAENSKLNLTNLNLIDNQAQFGGGAALLGERSEVSFTNNTIENNLATQAGGGVLIAATEMDVTNNLFIDNEAEITGGGLYLWRSTVNVINNTFAGNLSEEQGSAITAENGSVLEVNNSIVWDNTSTEEGEQIYTKNTVEDFAESTATVSYTLVEDGFSGEENLKDNPQFVDPDNGDYRLDSNSPALDVGNNELIDVDVDLDDNPRISNKIVDLGPYELSVSTNEIRGTDGNDSLVGDSENDLILGLEGKDTLSGNEGNDTLDGGPGNNRLNGDEGDDSLLGDKGKDRLRGGTDDDILDGGKGNDTLRGDKGKDILTGGSGSDLLEFSSPRDRTDTITDFDSGNDLIGISVDGFGGELEPGSLSSDQFVLGSSASEAQQRFIYSRNRGNLFYDSDGSGEAEQIKIAFLGEVTTLTRKDFLLF